MARDKSGKAAGGGKTAKAGGAANAVTAVKAVKEVKAPKPRKLARAGKGGGPVLAAGAASAPSAPSSPLYAQGMQVRRAVMGDSYVDAALADVDDFNRPLQNLVTEAAWGMVWTREDLPRWIRSMLNLAMLTALNRPHELKGHVRGALRNGVTPEEIREVLLQAAVYCGMPAAIDAFRSAREVLKAEAATSPAGVASRPATKD